MKKILGISLCALFAVSAANANIASTEWVQEQIGGIDTSGIQTNATAINGLTTRVAANESAIGTHTTNIATNASDINTLKGRVDEHDESIAANAGDITTNAGNIATNTANISTNTTNIAANATAISGINTTIEGMDANVTGSHFIQGVSQANGKVTPTGKNFETTLSETTNDNAPTSKAVADYVADKVSDLDVGTLEGRVTTNATNIATNTSDIATNATNISTNTGNIATNTANITALTTKVGTNETNIAGLTEQVGINESKINGLDEDIQDMDLTATTGDYVKVVSQSNGTVEATGASFDTSVSDTSNNAPTSKAVAGYVATNAVQTVAAGDTNGTIKVDGAPVAVTGLQALAYKDKVAAGDINPGAIVDADISDSARIATTKIAFSDAQKNALNSTIDNAKVTQIATNASNIGTLQTTVSEHNEALKPSSECMNNADGCTLVYRNNAYSWEKITREAQ